MRLVQFYAGTVVRPGVLVGESQILDLQAAAKAYPHTLPVPIDSILALLRQGEGAVAAVRALVDELVSMHIGHPNSLPEGILLQTADVHLAAPILYPQKIIAVGLNYRDHCEENHLNPPNFPLTFAKYPSAVIGPGEPIVWDRDVTQQVDYEAEFAFVIGKVARRVSEEEAMEYVAGYTMVNDVSARDIQFAEGQWVRAKSLDTFCPLGPTLVTKEEIPDPHNLDIKCLLNGIVVQHSNTKHLIFGVASLLSFLSKSMTLFPGDIVSTGTPGGVGYYKKPQLFLQRGDIVQVEIEKIGVLSNPVGGEGKF